MNSTINVNIENFQNKPRSTGECLNQHHLQSLSAMVAHAAYVKQTNVEEIETVVRHVFQVDHFAQLPATSFESVIRFVVEYAYDNAVVC